MLTNFQNINDHLKTVNYFQTARTICAKKNNTKKKITNFITSKWERLNKSEPTLLNMFLPPKCNLRSVQTSDVFWWHITIKSCLDLLPNTTNLTIQCDTTKKKSYFFVDGNP